MSRPPHSPIPSATGDAPTGDAATIPRPEGPRDACVRCGRPTAPGVSLCDADNPARLNGPSATQVHGTIFVGILIGFVLLAFGARALVAGVGPFESTVVGRSDQTDGSAQVIVLVTNEGTRHAAATCRIYRGTVPGPTDLVFLTPQTIPPGGSRSFERQIGPPAQGATSRIEQELSVRCT